MKTLSAIVTAAIAIATPLAGLSIQPAAAQEDTSVYVVAVGDIACDPTPDGPGVKPEFVYASYNNGDGKKDGCRHKAVGAAVMAAKPDQFWPLGDNQYFDGTYAKYMESYDTAFGPLKAITRPIPGNHEWKDLTLPTKPGSGYFTYFGAAARPESNGTYSFDAGDWHVLAINDNLCTTAKPCGPGSELAKWIASDMAANQKPCTAAMWHHPLWSLGEAHKEGYVPMVPVWNQLHELGVDMVLTGHDHNYVRTNPLGKASVDTTNPAKAKVAPPTLDPNGMVEFVIGTGGVDTYTASEVTAQALKPYLAAYQVGKPSPGLFGAAGFKLSSGQYTFSYLPAKDSHPFTDTGGRTCRRATNGNPQEVSGAPVTKPTLTPQRVSWAPENTTVKATSAKGGTVTPDEKATTDGNGAISYEVTSRGTTGCSVDATKGVIKYSEAGQCEVTATAAATTTYAEARRSVVFTITPGGPLKKQLMTAVQPASGPRAGGNTIILVGQGFADATKVTIDGTEATFTVVSDTRMSVVVPPAKNDGPANIRVTVGPPEGAIVAPGGYTYQDSVDTAASAAEPGTTPALEELSLGNPEAARTLAGGVRLLARADAALVSPRVAKRSPAASASAAPTVRVKAGTPLSLVIGGQAAGQVVSVRAMVRGRSVSLGSARADETGSLKIPAFAVSRAGVVTLSLATPAPGKPGYLKVLVVK